MTKEKISNYIGNEKLGIVEAMQKIDENAQGILFIVDDRGCLIGSLTDGDVRRWLIKTGELKADVSQIMNRKPKFLFENDKLRALEIIKENSITALPVINEKNNIVEIIFKSELSIDFDANRIEALKEVPVIIMAGGKGTRLYPYTKILPKPLIPIGDIPIVERIVNRFCQYGISNYFFTVNYKKGMIKSYFAEVDSEYKVCYVEEDKPLGTAGSIKLIDKKFEMPIIVTNCDTLIDADYANIYEYHKKSGNVLTIVSALKNIIVPYGVLHTKENGIIIQMDEKPKLSYFINTGMYVLNPEVIDRIPDDTFFNMTDLTDVLMKEGYQVGMYPVSEESFLDMGEFEEMHRMEEKLKQRSE